MAESYNSEESKRKAPGGSQDAEFHDPRFHESFHEICMEYKARIEFKNGPDKNMREFDQFLNVPVSSEAYVMVMALANIVGRSQEEIARELIEDGILSLLARAKAEGLAQQVPEDTSGF